MSVAQQAPTAAQLPPVAVAVLVVVLVLVDVAVVGVQTGCAQPLPRVQVETVVMQVMQLGFASIFC